MKNLIILIVLLLSGSAFGQDWCAWYFSFKFKVETTTKIYEVIDTAFYINDPYYALNTMSSNEKEKILSYDPVTNDYQLNLSYGCISCGYELAKEPPDIYIKVRLKNAHIKNPFSMFIPVYITKKDTNDKESWFSLEKYPIDLGTIFLSEFVDGYTTGNNQEILSPYEAIVLNRDKTITKRRKGDYTLKRMSNLIELTLENKEKILRHN